MNISAFNSQSLFEPSFEDERADLAVIFADLDAGDFSTLRNLTNAFFERGVTKENFNHAMQTIVPLQLDRRLDTCIKLTNTYSTIHSLMLAQMKYVLASPTMARTEGMAKAAATRFYEIAKEFDRHTMNEYSKGLKFMRDLNDLHIDNKETANDLFQARIFAHFPASPDDLARVLVSARIDMLEGQHEARLLDLEIAQFKMICVGAIESLALKPLLQEPTRLLQENARLLFDSTDADKAPGLADLAQAINLVGIIRPVLAAERLPAPKI